MTKEQEAVVRIIAEDGAKANEEMLKQRFPSQVSAPDARGRKDDQNLHRQQPE